MKIGTWMAIYFVIWWTVLFAVLPFGVRTQQEAGLVVPGSEASAPARPRFAMILSATTLVSAVVFAGLWWLIENYWMI